MSEKLIAVGGTADIYDLGNENVFYKAAIWMIL